MAKDGPLDSEGPSSPPPPLPDGWLAQWEGVERKWYFVQRATGKAQWEIPTEPVILTPSTTPTSTGTGPSRAPSSRPQTNSPPTGMGARGFGAEGGYGGADRAGYSSFFGSPGGAYQTGLSQMAMGMLGRMSNYGPQDKAVGQPGLPGYLAQQNPHQNPYGYMPTGQPGPYTGSPSQYPGAGHVQPTPGMFPHPQSGSPGQYAAIQGAQRLGLQQQFGVDAQGSLSSPFTQVPAHTQGQMAAAVTSSGGPSPFQAGIATTQAQGGSPFAVQSPEQQVTQAPSQPGVESSNPALGEHGTPNDFSGYSQAQQNLSVLSSQAPSVSPNQAALSSAEFPASQYPTTQAFGPFPQTTMPPPGLGPFPQNAPPGFPNAAQQSQYGQGAFGQYGQLPGQNPYGPYPPGAFGLPSQGSPYNAGRPGVTGPPVSVPPYGAQFPTTGPFGVQGAPGTSQLDQFGPQFDPRQYPRPPSDQMGRVAGFNMAPGAVNPQASFQQYSGPPYTAAGQWSGPGPAQSRSAIYDPQFVSGPWTSAAGYRQASPYGAFGPGK